MNVQSLKHGVVAVLQDETGRYLFIQRGLQLKRAPGYWCFVGGEVEGGETFEEAIVREVSEEVGLTVKAHEKIRESISPNGEFLLHWIRVSKINSAQCIQAHPQEVHTHTWKLPDEALHLSPMLSSLHEWLRERIVEQS